MAEIINVDILRQPHCPDNTLLKPGSDTDAGFDLALADDAIIPALHQVPRELVRVADVGTFLPSTLETLGYKEGALPKDSPFTIKDGGLWQMKYRPPLFRTGIHTLPHIPEGKWFMVALRSSSSTGWGLRLHNAIGVVDPGYQGEILLALYAGYDVPVLLPRGERVAQLIPIELPRTNLFMGTDKAILQVRNGRGGGWGSTNGEQPFGANLIASFEN